MAKKIICNPVNKGEIFKFHVGYMTHPILRERRTHREQVIKIFESSFNPKTVKYIKAS